MPLLRLLLAWYHTVLPFRGVGAIFFLIYFVLEAVCIIIEARMGRLLPGQFLAGENVPAAVVCAVAAFGYGIMRVAYFHPLWQPEYRQWLMSSPWTPRRPLPQGPVMPRLQDVVIVGVLTLLSLRAEGMRWFIVPTLFLASWVMISMATFAAIGPGWLAYILLGGCGLMTRFARSGEVVVAATFAVMVLLTCLGHFVSIRRFHKWDLSWTEKVNWDAILKSDVAAIQEAARTKLLGWPYDQLAPTMETRKFLISPLAGFFAALMIAWQYDCVLTLLDGAVPGGLPARGLRIMPRYVALILASIRLFHYADGYLAPISFFGRLAKFWPIIPRYDQILMVPIIVIGLGWFGTASLASLGIPHVTASSLTIGAAVFLTSTMPPDRVAFQLTGSHRIVPTTAQRQAKDFLK